MTLAALAVSCVVPGSMLSQSRDRRWRCHRHCTRACPIGERVCRCVVQSGVAVVDRCRLPGISLAGTIAAGIVVLLALFAARRARRVTGTLPAGTPSPLLRPPRQALCA